jgi:transposase
MSMARLVVTAVRLEGRPISQVARDYAVSRRWVHELVRRYDTHGQAGLEPRSRRPHRSPHATPPGVEEHIVTLRKQLAEQGLDAGAHTIAYHLAQRGLPAPSVATIWRVLTRRGLVTPNPRNARARPGNASRPTSPTSSGRPTSPTGHSPTPLRSRSSTCSTTTPAWPWPATPSRSSRPLTSWPASPPRSPPTDCPQRCSPTTARSSPAAHAAAAGSRSRSP